MGDDAMAVDGESYEATGRVKWFDPVKGFGFLVPDDGGADVLLHGNVLRNFGRSSVAEGAQIVFDVLKTPRGLQATAIRAIEGPPGEVEAVEGFGEEEQEEIARTPLEPARVKWFDRGKGFGFANVFGRSDDVFVHMDVVRRSGLADLQPGEAVGLRVVEGKRGRMALQVSSWDLAATEDNS